MTLQDLPAETLEPIIRRQAKLAKRTPELCKMDIHQIVSYGLACGMVAAKQICSKAGINPMWKIPQVMAHIPPCSFNKNS